MDKEENFCLKWNDYSSNLEKSFRELRADRVLFDVTLACENRSVEAHRVVLSVCSNFFKEVLARHPHSHPLLYLRGVKMSQLTALLDFVYNGEVNVGQSDLSEFLAVAGDLEIKGLTPDSRREELAEKAAESLESEAESETAGPPSPPQPPSKRRRASPNLGVRSDLIPAASPHLSPRKCAEKPLLKVEQEMSSEDQMDLMEEAELGGVGDEDGLDFSASEDFKFEQNTVSDLYDEHNTKVDLMVRSKMMETGDGWACSQCSFGGTIRKVYQHVEMNHVAVQYYCQLCQKVCKTRNSLFCHRYRYHRNKSTAGDENMAAHAAAKSSQSFSPPNKAVSSQSPLNKSSYSVSLPIPSSNYILAKIENQ